MGLEKVVPRIPVVELTSEKLNPGSDSWKSAQEEVRKALEKYGCFELVYSKFSIENHNSILKAMDEFYNLPDEIKAKSIRPDFVHDYGYSGKSPALPMCETLGIVNADDKQECQNLTQLVWPQGNRHFWDGAMIE
ncbi:2-oxoglutarate (2OG) and Fe(II)-dependent oxygenase superfamily protein [Euphorbia peplus]|nr:2-oxoglutarate (2OG) and Fe(II)-dependent oxygenase superfamily protein [Euphorbia peplus]